MTTLTSKYGTNKTGVFDWEIINSNTNAIKDRGYLIDASSNTVTLTLLASPSQGDAIGIKDYNDSAATHTITIARNGKNIVGVAEDLTFDITGFSIYMVYSDATTGWVIVSGTAGNDNSISDVAYGTTWSGVTDIAPSKNTVYVEMETKADKGVNSDITLMTGLDDDGIPVAKVSGEIETAALAGSTITDNRLTRGDGGSRGVQESTIIVDDSGRMTNPSQPCFLVQPTSSQDNIAVGSDVTIIFGTERFDQDNNFADNTFTAPITGRYALDAVIYCLNVDAGTKYYITIKTSNQIYYSLACTKFSGDCDQTLLWSGLVDMDVNDTAYVDIKQVAGVQQTDIATYSLFSGALIC